MDGILNVYKEKGFTSHDVVAKLRGILHQKKIGHTGTLDPDAVGVLPVCLGKATKLCDMLTDTDKSYRATLLLGYETDTQDMGGQILQERTVAVGEEEVLDAIRSFVGAYDQVPPMYSALKVDGKRLYELAREGKVIERKSRKVEIKGIEIESVCLPRVVMTVHCSKGTYIRTLCHDIGQVLNCGGAMEELVRIRAGIFKIEESLTLTQIEHLTGRGELTSHLMGIQKMFPDLPTFRCESEYSKALQNGNILKMEWGRLSKSLTDEDNRVMVLDWNGNLVGIYEQRSETDMLHPKKCFYRENLCNTFMERRKYNRIDRLF